MALKVDYSNIGIGDAILIKEKYMFSDNDPNYYVECDIGICISGVNYSDSMQKFYLINSRVIAFERPSYLFSYFRSNNFLLVRYNES